MIRINLNNKKSLFLIVFSLLFALGISQIISISLGNLLFTILIGLVFVSVKIDQAFVLIFSLLPFFNFFTVQIGSTSLFYIFVIVFMFKYIVYKKYKISKIKVLILTILLVDRIFSFDFLELSKWWVLFSFLVISYNEDFANKNLKNVVKYLTYSYILASAFGYYMHINGLSIYTNSYVYSKEFGATTRFAGLVGDSVFYGQFSAVIISANLVLGFFEKNKRSIIKMYCSVILITLFTLLSYSKTGILLCVACILGYAICLIIKNSKSRKTIIKSLLIIFVLIVGFILLIRYIVANADNAMISNYITRFTAADLFTGRNEIAEHYIDLIQSNYKHIFVSMTQKDYFSPFSPNGITMINRSHNIYIETICCFGLIPTIIIMLWFLKRIFYVFKAKKELIILMPLVVMILTGFVLHGHFESQYYFLISLSLLMISSKEYIYKGE
ncbi:O-antigen ligase family protein [Sporanaerobacter acetigenes]|uniref:O-antigen ligase family protein n=1 Tax=Sporanaerobacter acetigenes TaxID=165813 RepID=UPI003328017E